MFGPLLAYGSSKDGINCVGVTHECVYLGVLADFVVVVMFVGRGGGLCCAGSPD